MFDLDACLLFLFIIYLQPRLILAFFSDFWILKNLENTRQEFYLIIMYDKISFKFTFLRVVSSIIRDSFSSFQ